jgi:hypothetical protein
MPRPVMKLKILPLVGQSEKKSKKSAAQKIPKCWVNQPFWRRVAIQTPVFGKHGIKKRSIIQNTNTYTIF